MQDQECHRCPLFIHLQTNTVPAGAEVAWAVYRKLTRPAIERFGLQREAWDALGIERDPEELDVLIDQLSAFEEGVRDADAELAAKKRNQPKK